MSTRSLVLAALLAASLPSVAAAQQGTSVTRSYNGRSCRVYVPASYRAGAKRPLVVLLHGCTQDPADFARGTEFDRIADQHGLLVLYPQQTQAANQNKCWNWFEPGHQARGRGEPASIVGCVEGVAKEWGVDRERVYVGGLSAGGGMTSILGVTYPDVFAAIAVHAGLQFDAANDVGGAFLAMFQGGPNPEASARSAISVMGSRKRVVPTLVVHGTGDNTVRPINGEHTIRQFAQIADLVIDGQDDDDVSGRPTRTRQEVSAAGLRYTVYDHDYQGATLLRRIEVEGMSHAWSGGSSAGSYTDPQGPSASEAMWAFFSQHTRSGASAPTTGGNDTTPPTTTVAPPAGRYPNPVDVELVSSEQGATYFTLDGSAPSTRSQRYSQPIRISGDTTLTYFSVDAAGNHEAAQQVRFEIGAAPVTPTPITPTPVTPTPVTPGTPTTGTPTTGTPTTPGAPCLCATKTLVVKSSGALDGFLGRYRAWGGGAGQPKVGDKGMFQQDLYRAFLSFDTRALPDNATVVGVVLRVRRASAEGSPAEVAIDLQRGHFGAGPGVERDDFDAPATAYDAGRLSAPARAGEQSEATLQSAAHAAIDAQGTTQVRLRAVIGKAQFKARSLTLFGGEDGNDAPELVIRYQ